MEYKNLLIENDNGVVTLTVNRPQALNSLNSETLGELGCALYQLEYDATAKVIIITGAGEKAFVAGADIKEMSEMNAYEGHQFGRKGQHVMLAMEKMKTPVIAAVNGFALGGGWVAGGESGMLAAPGASPPRTSSSVTERSATCWSRRPIRRSTPPRMFRAQASSTARPTCRWRRAPGTMLPAMAAWPATRSASTSGRNHRRCRSPATSRP